MKATAFYQQLAQRAELKPSKMFGWDGLKLGASYVAFTKQGRVAIKLPPEAYDEAAARDGARPFDPGENGRPMKGWLEVPTELEAEVWLPLAEAGMAWVASGAGVKGKAAKAKPAAKSTTAKPKSSSKPKPKR